MRSKISDKKMILIKIHKSYRIVVAIADSNLLGKRFEEGKKQLEIKGHFFNGGDYSEEEALEIMKKQLMEDATFNIVGHKSIELAMESGIINEESIGKVAGIPFALRFL